jgi:phage shock protein PspC (stress-responsive transcriptional regulator)
MTTADEITKLHDLLAKGAISQAEFDQAKARLLAGEPAGSGDWSINSLRLSNEDRWIAGVCGGISRVTGVEPWIWRVIMLVGLFASGVSLILYLLLWIFVPRDTK